MVKRTSFSPTLQRRRFEEPISGPPAWRFSVTLARVRAKPKETRTERRNDGTVAVGRWFEPWDFPGENGNLTVLSHRTMGNSEEQWRFYVHHGDLYGMYS